MSPFSYGTDALMTVFLEAVDDALFNGFGVRSVKRAGVRVFPLFSAEGAWPKSWVFYLEDSAQRRMGVELSMDRWKDYSVLDTDRRFCDLLIDAGLAFQYHAEIRDVNPPVITEECCQAVNLTKPA